jgi:hypothetical protein
MRIRVIAAFVGLLATLLVFSLAGANWPEQSYGQGSSDIWVMNLHETEDANVVASYVNQDGDPDASVGGTIDPLGNTSFPASSSGLEDGWLGSVVLYSDQELASAVDLFWHNVPAGDGWSGGLYSGYSEGSNDIFFPVVSRTYYHRSLLTIQCVDTVDCPVWLTYRGEDGSDVDGNPFYEVIEADSQETHDVWDPTLNPNVPTGVPVPWYGSLHVTSTQKIAGVSVTHWWLGYAASYNALVPGTDTELHFTSVNRRNWANWHGQSDWSQITIQNLNPISITVYQTYYDRDGGPPVLQIEDDVPAYSSHLYNTRYGDAVDPSVFEALGDTFLGSVLVTSTHPIAGTGRVIRYPSYGLAGAYQGVPSSASSNSLSYPVAYRVINGNAWVGYSSLFVQNLDTDNAITVHVQYLNPDGTVGVEFDDDIPANATHPYNTRFGGETPDGAATFEPLGTSWRGPIIVTTTSPEGILGMVNNHTLGSGYIYLGLDNIQ